MSNNDKRAKRAKLKAKQARLIKAKEKVSLSKNHRDVIKISPELIDLFKTLPEFSSKYECLPMIKEHDEKSSISSSNRSDQETRVAMAFVMYGHWSTSGSTSIDKNELMDVTAALIETPEFIEQFSLIE